jgi:hypothetical protein
MKEIQLKSGNIFPVGKGKLNKLPVRTDDAFGKSFAHSQKKLFPDPVDISQVTCDEKNAHYAVQTNFNLFML